MNVHSIAQELFDDIQQCNGGTRSVDNTVVSEGYLVGGVVKTFAISDSEFGYHHVLAFVALHQDQLHSHRFVGGWVDNGTVYLDVTERYSSEVEAHRVAKERGELAYYVAHEGRTVFV